METEKMVLIGGRFYDKNGNSWGFDENYCTEEQALAKSKTLNDCHNCMDCENCSSCYNCVCCKFCFDCSYCYNCYGCTACARCTRCSNSVRCHSCHDCSECRDCSDCRTVALFIENPNRYTTPKVGSRSAQTTIYWTTAEDAFVVCGCFYGSLKTFEERVEKVHRNTEHLKGYRQQIEIMKTLIHQVQ